MTDSLLAKIKHRVLELMIVKDVSRAEATRLAAKEYGRTIKDDAKPRKSTHASEASSSNLREEFFARIMAIRERMLSAEARPRGPIEAIKHVIERIKFKEDDEPVMPKPVEATPNSTMGLQVYVGRSSPEMLNREFDNGPFRDNEATSNWRRSLTESKPVNRTDLNPVDATDPRSVEQAYQRQQSFLRVVK
jgi:hypothetical protein